MTSVLFDATSIPPTRGGVARFIESILPELALYRDLELHVVCKQDHLKSFQEISDVNVHGAPARVRLTPQRFLWEQFGLAKLAHQLDAQVVVSPHYTFPLKGRFARVVVVHDLTFFSLPQFHSRTKRAFFRWWIKRAAASSALIVTPSSATAQALISVTKMSPQRIEVAPLGFNRDIFHTPSARAVEEFKQHYGLPKKPWIAFLGTLEPRKNVPNLIEAFSRVNTQQGYSHALLLAGGKGWDAQVTPAIDRAREQGHDVRQLGYLPLESIPALLRGADIVAYPSFGEGFGLPVLEAMACGSVVLTTEALSLPEVGGTAVEYCDATAESIAEHISLLLNNPRRGQGLRTSAVKRASEFSWHRTAKQLHKAISEAANSLQ